jgi:DtxR family Mn-dependent transcriptional regulator
MIGVKDNSSKFLKYADSLGLAINQRIKLIDRYEYDDLLEIEIKGIRNKISPKFAEQIIVVCNTCTKKHKIPTPQSSTSRNST